MYCKCFLCVFFFIHRSIRDACECCYAKFRAFTASEVERSGLQL